MATSVNYLVNQAAKSLMDESFVHWTQEDLLAWLNCAQNEVAVHKPESSQKTVSLELSAGSTKQSLPSDGNLLMSVVRNMGADGNTPGAAIRYTTRDVLDAQRPNWHSDANTIGVVQLYTYDIRSPKQFYVYPKAPSSWNVEITYGAKPTECVLGGNITIDDSYSNALVDYMLYRAHGRDAEYGGNAALATAHYQAFATAVGLKTQGEATRSPGANNSTASP